LLNGVLFFNVFNDGGTKFLLLPVVNPFTEKESVVRVSLEVKPSLKRKQMGGGVSILVALPLLNHTISAGKSKWEGDRFKVSAGRSKLEGDIGSEGFTRSEALTYNKIKWLATFNAALMDTFNQLNDNFDTKVPLASRDKNIHKMYQGKRFSKFTKSLKEIIQVQL